jgi:hypothetical protein
MVTAIGMSRTEQNARKALLSSAILLVVGLALVGVGEKSLGAFPVIVGLFLAIFAIHIYGRLGPEEAVERAAVEGAADPDELRTVAKSWIWQGGLAILAGVLVTAGSYSAAEASGGWYVVASGPVLWGTRQIFRGWTAIPRAKKTKAKVEKRRRMDKSPPP